MSTIGRRPTTVEAQIYQRLTQQHRFSPAGAAAVMGNIKEESRFNPAALHDRDAAGNPTGYGLFGHRLDRRDELFSFSGTRAPTVDQQIDFAVLELDRDYPKLARALRSAGDPAALADRFTREFERPAQPNQPWRGEHARRYVELFGASAAVSGEQPMPALGDIAGAALRSQNTLGSLLARESRSNVQVDPGYDPFSDGGDVLGTWREPYARRYIDSVSAEDTAIIDARIQREERDRQTLDDAGWLGFGAQVVAGIVDPINLIPVGGSAYKLARGGVGLARSIAAGTMAGVAGAALSEGALQATQETRTAEETAFAIGTAGVLSGVLGGAAGVLARRGSSVASAAASMDAGSRIYDDVRTQLLDAGRPDAEAGAGAQLWRAHFEAMAQRTGRTADDLYRAAALDIKAGGDPAAAALHQLTPADIDPPASVMAAAKQDSLSSGRQKWLWRDDEGGWHADDAVRSGQGAVWGRVIGDEEMPARLSQWRPDHEIRWSRDVSDIVEGKLGRDIVPSTGRTPNVLQALGVQDQPVYVPQDVVRKVLSGKHRQDMPRAVVNALPGLLRRPVLVIQDEGRYALVLDAVDKNKNQIIAVVEPNGLVARKVATVVVTIHGRTDFSRWLQAAKSVVYADSEKAPQLLRRAGIAAPGSADSLTSGAKAASEARGMAPERGPSFEKVLSDQDVIKKFKHLQEDVTGPKGSIEFGPETIIRLFGLADQSTFLHESGHFFLEHLRRLSDTAPELKADLDAAYRWMGVEAGKPPSVDALEKWARGFEAWLREGRAPSAELASAFRRFSEWLTQIYRSARELLGDDQVTDDVRGVMRRLLSAGDEAPDSIAMPEASTAGAKAVFDTTMEQERLAWGIERVARADARLPIVSDPLLRTATTKPSSVICST